MRELKRDWLLREGTFAGAIAGLSFASVQILLAAMSGLKPGAPWEYSASLLMGQGALRSILGWGTFFAGAVIHFGLSIVFGLLFALYTWRLKPSTRNAYGPMLWRGALFGGLVWFVNFEVFGRIAFPWFIQTTSWFLELVTHVIAFGIPLSYWLVLRLRDLEVPGVHRMRHEMQTSTGSEEVARFRRDLVAERKAGRQAPAEPPAGPS